MADHRPSLHYREQLPAHTLIYYTTFHASGEDIPNSFQAEAARHAFSRRTGAAAHCCQYVASFCYFTFLL